MTRCTYDCRDGLQEAVLMIARNLHGTAEVHSQGMGALAIQQAISKLLGVVSLLLLHLYAKC